MQHSETFAAVAAALAGAAAKFQPIARNRTVSVATRNGGSYSFTYATLDAIVAAVRPALSEAGLVLVQSVITEEVTESTADGVSIRREEMLETRLLHASGEWLSNLTPVLVSDGENSAQAYGSAITYARRYGITQLLCVVADEDDDGNAAAGNVARSTASGSSSGASSQRGGAAITPKQAGLIRVKLNEAGGNEAGLCVLLKIEAIEALPKSRMDEALLAITNRAPEIFEGGSSQKSPDAAAKAAERKARHDAVAATLSESLTAIRWHLGQERSEALDLEASDLGLGDRSIEKAVAEWREISQADQEALWLAPSAGGYFTTKERDALRAAVAATNTTKEG